LSTELPGSSVTTPLMSSRELRESWPAVPHRTVAPTSPRGPQQPAPVFRRASIGAHPACLRQSSVCRLVPVPAAPVSQTVTVTTSIQSGLGCSLSSSVSVSINTQGRAPIVQVVAR
jgi:hypothetical protein